ncbi:helix-turn-helix domain-containing protein [Clostridium sp. DJ247]|uniref:helix-turn-helix domain-containing protein n=1 Tax=Clostridium sp. DJ247 TaxID=2726188 RepID=UPI00162A408D|nr:helix-turn-helix domain-containing protein [Clostridium sp. DJ247]MBC2579077.1 sigma-70 family RNA polymerase sigma factor [Clostridium sp. DJ247]
MPLTKLNEKEREKVIYKAKKGDKLCIQMIVDSFQGLIRNSYKELSYEKYHISQEDYTQECNVRIIECINKSTKKTYGQLRKFVETSIRNMTIDSINKNFNDFNIFIDDISYVLDKSHMLQEHKFDDLVVSDMIVNESYDALIKDKLSKEEHKVLSSYISGQEFEDYASKKGIKTDSVKRTFRRAVNKIQNKEQIREFHCIVLMIFACIKNIRKYIDLADITELVGLVDIAMI